MKDYKRRVFDATVASSAEATATGRVAAALVGRGRGVDVAAVVGEAAEVSMSDSEGLMALCEITFRSLTAHTLKSYADKLSQFKEFCPDTENTSPLEATTAAIVVRGLNGVSCRVRDVHVDSYNITLQMYIEKPSQPSQGCSLICY
eukprot:jgi/Tetstr1/446445/TSEL_033987.t1